MHELNIFNFFYTEKDKWRTLNQQKKRLFKICFSRNIENFNLQIFVMLENMLLLFNFATCLFPSIYRRFPWLLDFNQNNESDIFSFVPFILLQRMNNHYGIPIKICHIFHIYQQRMPTISIHFLYTKKSRIIRLGFLEKCFLALNFSSSHSNSLNHNLQFWYRLNSLQHPLFCICFFNSITHRKYLCIRYTRMYIEIAIILSVCYFKYNQMYTIPSRKGWERGGGEKELAASILLIS